MRAQEAAAEANVRPSEAKTVHSDSPPVCGGARSARLKKPLAVVHGIHAMCERLGVRGLAEGVETVEEYAWLRGIGIELFQGFLFARPGFQMLPTVDFAEARSIEVEPIEVERHVTFAS